MSPKSALITGCSKGGIGSELAFELQKAGLRVFATARNIFKIDTELVELPNVEVLELDVVSPESIAVAVKAVAASQRGGLDILINNSVYGYSIPFADADLDLGRKLFEVNVWGVFAVTQAFLPLILQSRGVIVNNSSVSAVVGLPFQSMYTASKAALTTATETMRLELAPFGIKVVSLITGQVKSEFATNVEDSTLPPDSMYKQLQDDILNVVSGKGRVNKIQPTKVYAHSVVQDILGGANGLVWQGSHSSTIRFVKPILPTFLLDRILSQDSGLERLP